MLRLYSVIYYNSVSITISNQDRPYTYNTIYTLWLLLICLSYLIITLYYHCFTSLTTNPPNQEQQVTSGIGHPSSTECSSDPQDAGTGSSRDLVLRLRGGGGSNDYDTPVRRTRSTRTKVKEKSETRKASGKLGTPTTSTAQVGFIPSQAKSNSASPYRSIALPAPFSHPYVEPNRVNSEKALRQQKLASHGHGAYEVPWQELLLPQAWDILTRFNVPFSEGDSQNRLTALLVKSPSFISNWGPTVTNLKKYMKFNFDIGYGPVAVHLQKNELL